jgi:hypothetical protein
VGGKSAAKKKSEFDGGLEQSAPNRASPEQAFKALRRSSVDSEGFHASWREGNDCVIHMPGFVCIHFYFFDEIRTGTTHL